MIKDDLKQAREILIKYGFLLRVSDLELYHGRVAKNGEAEWQVDPSFDNSGNKTRNKNINKIKALSAGDRQVAQDFADERLSEIMWQERRLGSVRQSAHTEVHQIVSSDPEAVIINKNFRMENLSEKDQDIVKKALATTCVFMPSQFVPYSFEERNQHEIIRDKISNFISITGMSIISQENFETIYEKIHSEHPEIKKDLVFEVVSALNTRRLLSGPKYVKTMVESFIGTGYGNEQDTNISGFPFNIDYVAAWLANNHMIGMYRQIDSATLGRICDAYSLFDLEKINTKKAVGEKHQQMMQKYGAITSLVNSLEENKTLWKGLKFATPEETMKKLRSHPELDEYFSKSARVWEKFTVGEHTETVLRIFESTYEDVIPQDLIPFAKLALVSHDIGKGYWGQDGMDQDVANKKYASKFYDIIKLSPELKQMLLFVIGTSQAYTTDYFVKKNKDALKGLEAETAAMLKETLKREPTPEEVEGLMEVCKMLQTCDGGAYTRYAITRREGTNDYYHNGNDRFTQSFKPQNDFRKRFEMKEPGEE